MVSGVEVDANICMLCSLVSSYQSITYLSACSNSRYSSSIHSDTIGIASPSRVSICAVLMRHLCLAFMIATMLCSKLDKTQSESLIRVSSYVGV